MAEAGGPELEVKSWLSLVAPRGTPTDVVKKLHDGFKKAMEEPSYVQTLARYDMLPIYMDSAQYARFALDTFLREKALVEKLGLFKAQ